MIRWLLALLVALTTTWSMTPGASRPLADPEPSPTATVVTPPPIRRSAPMARTAVEVGDSLTEGRNAVPGYRGYLADARPSWRFYGPLGEAPLAHAGYSGYTIDQLTPMARSWGVAFNPAVFIVMAGTNDAGAGHSDSADQMISDMRALVAELRAGSPLSKIILMAPFATPINTPAQQAALQQYGDRLLAGEIAGVDVIDQRGIPVDAPDHGDGVHPNAAGYATMAERITPRLFTLGVW